MSTYDEQDAMAADVANPTPDQMRRLINQNRESAGLPPMPEPANIDAAIADGIEAGETDFLGAATRRSYDALAAEVAALAERVERVERHFRAARDELTMEARQVRQALAALEARALGGDPLRRTA